MQRAEDPVVGAEAGAEGLNVTLEVPSLELEDQVYRTLEELRDEAEGENLVIDLQDNEE